MKHHALLPLLFCLLLNTAAAETAFSVTASHQNTTPLASAAVSITASSQNTESSASAQDLKTQDLKTLEQQFQEKMLNLRKETLDSQQETIAWWLGLIGVAISIIGLISVILPLAFYWRERSNMLENLKQAINEAKGHTEQAETYLNKAKGYTDQTEKYLNEAKKYTGDAEKYLSEIKNQHQTAADYTAQIQQMRDYQSNSDNTATQQAAVQAANDLQDNEQIPLAERLRAHAIVFSEKAKSYTEHEQAFYAWQAVIQHSPNDVDALFNAAHQAYEAYKQSNRLQQSVWFPHIEQGYKQVLELNPKHLAARNNLGNALSREARALAQNKRFDEAWDKWDGAYKQYYEASRIQSDDYEIAYNWGLALSHEAQALAYNNRFDKALDKWDEAYKQYNEALRIKPDFYQAAYNRINSLIHTYHARKQNQQDQAAQAKLVEAQNLAEGFIQNYPQHAAELAYNLACVYALSGSSADKVVEQLKLSASGGKLPSKNHIEQEKDLDSIRHSPAFQNWFKQTFPE